MQKIEIRKPVKGISSREKGGSWFLGLNEDPLDKVEGLGGHELDALQLGIHQRLGELQEELDQLTMRLQQRRLASKKLKRFSSKSENQVGLN